MVGIKLGSVTKRGSKYYARVRVMHNYILKSEGKSFTSKIDALLWIKQKESNIINGEAVQIDRTKKVKDAVIRFIDEVCPKRHGGRNEAIRLNAILLMPDFPADIPLTKLQAKHIAIWRDNRPIQNASKNREIAILRTVFKIARKEWNWLEEDPLKELESLRKPAPRNRRISDHEISLIIENLGYKDKTPKTQMQTTALIFLFALETAMRQGEIASLDWRQVNLAQKYLTLLETKNGDKRDVPLSSRAIELLELMKPQRAGSVFNISADVVSTTFRRAVKRCFIQDLTFHDARHEACTRLARKLEVLDLARMIGHRDLNSLMIYYNPTATEIANRLG